MKERLRKGRRPLAAVALLYLVFFGVGIAAHPELPEITVQSLDFFELVIHNVVIVVIIAVGGLLWSIPSLIVFGWNAFIFGGIYRMLAREPILWAVQSLHAVPEFLGQLIAVYAALEVTRLLRRKLLGSSTEANLRRAATLLLAAVVVTVGAAVVEVYVTVPVAHSILTK